MPHGLYPLSPRPTHIRRTAREPETKGRTSADELAVTTQLDAAAKRITGLRVEMPIYSDGLQIEQWNQAITTIRRRNHTKVKSAAKLGLVGVSGLSSPQRSLVIFPSSAVEKAARDRVGDKLDKPRYRQDYMQDVRNKIETVFRAKASEETDRRMLQLSESWSTDRDFDLPEGYGTHTFEPLDTPVVIPGKHGYGISFIGDRHLQSYREVRARDIQSATGLKLDTNPINYDPTLLVWPVHSSINVGETALKLAGAELPSGLAFKPAIARLEKS